MKYKIKTKIEYEREVDSEYYPSQENILDIEMSNLTSALAEGDISHWLETGKFFVTQADLYPEE